MSPHDAPCPLALWKDAPSLRAPLEEAGRALRCGRAPRFRWTFERVCMAISTVGSVLCVAGFAYLVFGR